MDEKLCSLAAFVSCLSLPIMVRDLVTGPRPRHCQVVHVQTEAEGAPAAIRMQSGPALYKSDACSSQLKSFQNVREWGPALLNFFLPSDCAAAAAGMASVNKLFLLMCVIGRYLHVYHWSGDRVCCSAHRSEWERHF